MDAKPMSTSKPKGIAKSNSTASTGARSTRSHESVSVVGAHPLGSLRVLRPESSPHSTEQQATDQDDDNTGPTSWLPTAGETYLLSGSRAAGRQDFSASPAKLAQYAQSHTMGGGDVAIFIDLPEYFTVGYDAISFAAKNFGGVRDIPRGPHFFWVAHPSGVAARTGVWLFGSESRDRVHVVQWDKYNEVLTETPRSEARNLAEKVPNIHAKLVPFSDPSAVGGAVGQLSASKSEANRKMWKQLTTNVTTSLLNRITGPQVGGWIVHTLDRALGVVQFSAEVQLERAVPNKNLQLRQLKFTFERTTRLFSVESIGPERTREAIDPTTYLLSQIEDPSSDLVHEDLVGEFQFSFIVGILLGNDACLDQWWFMVLKLLVKSHLLIEIQPILAASLWHALAAQFTYGNKWMDTTLLDRSEPNCRELRVSLIIYKRRMKEFLHDHKNNITTHHLAVSTAFSKLEAVLANLGWNLSSSYLRKGTFMLEDGEEIELELSELEAEDERGEWAPEIVELDDDGRQLGLVSWSN
ncbi:hypothetical protein QQS21_001764 [Conoideocrella luteorostrata]|uniref:AAR2-domain-containing protein n=1 Tax=Conoideocrella luteorostrata TaxID=1105319 RepID=A0AAJ0CZG7_9HYPO|nr:hypothetical protein QQS21_001764 [Conoideocrella luteorostrata]